MGILNPMDVTGDVNADLSAVRGTYGSLAPLNGLTVLGGGSVRGDISVALGTIEFINVAGGDIGSPGSPVTITTDPTLPAKSITASSIHMNLTTFSTREVRANSGDLTGSMTLHRVLGVLPTGVYAAGDLTSNITITDYLRSTIDVDGNLTGSVLIDNVGGSIATLFDIAGDVTGDLTITEGLKSSKTLRIGGSLHADADLAFGTDSHQSGGVGLAGQVIINADNGSGTWDGDVRILKDVPANDIVLSGPGYSNRSLYLGGGAVGEGPYGSTAPTARPSTARASTATHRPSAST